ncbi:hypothetical protein BJX65DRAFT_301990 [Aspergillus insuetus]
MRKDLAPELYTIFVEGKREITGIPDDDTRAASTLLRFMFIGSISAGLGLSLYLEATEEGGPGYEQLLFETSKMQLFDGVKHGIDVRLEYVFTIRPANWGKGEVE